MMFRRLLVSLLALALVSALGCDKQRTDDAPEAVVSNSAERVFGWRDALNSTRAEAEAALGAPVPWWRDKFSSEQVAEAEAKKGSALDPCGERSSASAVAHSPLRDRTRLRFGVVRGCLFAPEATAAELDYAITSIVYADDTAMWVRLKPRVETTMSDDLHARFDLPRLPLAQHRPGPDVLGRRESHRALGVAKEEGEIRGIDVIVAHDAPDRVVEVWVFDEDPGGYTGLYLAEYGPPPAAPTLVLPQTSGVIAHKERAPYAELRVDGAEIGRAELPIYPPVESPPLRFESGVTVAPGRLAAERAAWSGKLEADFAEKRREGELLNTAFEPSLTIAAERTLPASDLVELMAGTPKQPRLRFYLLGRNTGGEPAPSPTYGWMGASILTYADAAPQEGLSLTIEPKGFALRQDGEPVPPIEGCPEDGPTVCREQLVEAGPVLEEVRRLQLAGNYPESEEALRPLVDSYDWAGLYNTLVSLRGDDSVAIAIDVADPEAPIAVLARVLKVSAYRRSAAQAAEGECAAEFADDEALWASKPCEDDRSLRSLFAGQTIVGR